ncbi:hypothetical protein Cpir12675_003889 [Ceratocystis pirilliformis]|uniref:Gem-associated protein 5 TPR domain-containing protein n=1 Tax=Ceratocystis pirilliformis TaxID=259994 RepID=A0ABR3YZQ2_9PEZI
MSKISRTRASSHDSARSRGRTNDLRDFKTTRYDQLIRDFEPCAATSSMFLYAQGSMIICCLHQTLEIERRFTRHSEAIQLLAVDNVSQQGAGRLVVSYDAGQTAIVWDLKTGEEIARFASYSHLTTATWMKNGNIAFGNIQGHVIQFEPATSEHLSTRTLSQIPITSLAVANDSATFAIGYQNGTLLVAALGERFNVLHTLATNRAPSPIVTLQWHSSTPQQKSIMLAAQARDSDLRVWSVPKANQGGVPTAVRILSKNEQKFASGPNWMSWSKNGRIIQYSDKETLSWDVRTRHVTRDPIPTGSDIRGIAIYGTGATLFTLGIGGRVQQFDLNSPSVLVADIQHSSHLLPPSPPFSIEEVVKAAAPSTFESEKISVNGEYAGSEKNLDIYAPEKGITRQDYSNMEFTSFESARVGLSAINGGSSLPTTNGHRKMGTSENTYISTGSYLNSLPYNQKQAAWHHKQQSVSEFQSQSSLNTKSTFPRPLADRIRSKSRSGLTREPEQQANLDIFKYTRTRLDDIPYRPSIRGGAHLTNDDLRRQMLNTVFGWNGEVEELILDEMARHPRGSFVRIILSKWIGKEPDEEEIMASADLMFSSDWMLLALSGVGTQPCQKKLGRTYITKLLEQRELHAAVTIMLGMGDHIDAIEVYHSHKRYLEALILACLYLPSVWERQSAILKKWGEWAVQHGQKQLAIRCFACTEHEPTEPWTSPSAMQLSFQSLDHSVFSPPLSPPSTMQRTGRQIAKTSALKLITNFDEPGERKKFFSEESLSAETPAANSKSIKDADIDYNCNGEGPTTAVHHPSNRSAFATPTATSMQSNASINNGHSRKRLPSIGESSAESRRLNPANRPVVQTQDSPETNNQLGLSNAMNLKRAVTASPMMMRTDYPRLTREQALPSPRAVLSQKMEIMHIRNASLDKINRMNLNIDTTKAMNIPDNQSGSTYSRYRWPRRRGPGSISSINSGSTSRSIAKPTKKPAHDGYISSLDFTLGRQQASRQDGDERERSQGPSLERGRSTSRNYPAKRSPRSPVPMSPEDIVSLKISSITSANMATPATPTGKTDERLQTSGYSKGNSSRQYSRTRFGSTDETNTPLTPSAVHIPAQIWTASREIKPYTSSTPISSLLKPSLAGSEYEGDYQLALADQEKFRRARSASRGRSTSRTRIHKDADLPGPSVTEKIKAKNHKPQDKEVPSQLEFHGHAGDLRIIKEERQRKREMAAKELEHRRKELVGNTKTSAIPYPQGLSMGEFISRPRTANEVITVFGRDIPRSLTADPYSLPNPSQNLSFGVSISPKTIGFTEDLSQVGDHPPATTQASAHPQQPPKGKSKGMLSLASSQNIQVTPGLATSGLPLPSHTQESLAFLPSTVYRPPSKGIPRSQSAPIPDEPSFLHSRDNYRQHERLRKNSHSSRQDNNRSNPPPVLKELQHLVSSNPTTMDSAGPSEAMLSPPPPPPIGYIPTTASALATGMIEIVKDDNTLPRIQHKASQSVGRNTPVIVSQSDLMVPILSAPAPPMRGQTRGRSSTDSNIAERLNKATEHLRSTSRTRKENSKQDMPRSPQDGPGSVSYDNTTAQAQYVWPAPSRQQSQGFPLLADLKSLPTGMKKNEFF